MDCVVKIRGMQMRSSDLPGEELNSEVFDDDVLVLLHLMDREGENPGMRRLTYERK